MGRVQRQTIAVVLRRRGGRWIVSGEELADGRLICQLAENRRDALDARADHQRLLAFRADFRRIASRGSIAGLFMCVDHRNLDVVRLGIWLMGRTRSKAAISEVSRFIAHPDPRVRREAARALRRLGGWARLRDVAFRDSDPRMRRLATARRPKPFQQRMQQLARSISAVPTDVETAPAELYVKLPLGAGRLPRTAAVIRAILERIRRTLSA
jgi:hypothetical protein